MKLKYEIQIIEIDGRPMGIPIDSGEEFRGVLRMNGTTQDIVEILKNDVTEDELVSLLKKKYDATEEEIRRSVEKVIGTLKEYNLLSEV